MNNRPRQRLTLELEPEAKPLGGQLCNEDGQTWRFSNWLGLLAALGEATARAAHLDGPSQTAGSS